MAHSLGIDLGTTKIAALVLDLETGKPAAVESAPNDARLASRPQTSAWDPRRMLGIALAVAGSAVEASHAAESIRVVGVTGQMHGVVLVGPDLVPLTPFLGWQDRRCDAPAGGFPSTIDWMAKLAGAKGYARTGGRMATGYLGATLFWLARHKKLPAPPATATFLPDYLVAQLAAQAPVTDATNAAGSGLFDVAKRRWDEALITALGLPRAMLPEVHPTGHVAGWLAEEPAMALGLKPGLPVLNALGDNQASFFGSVAQPEEDLLVNVGTGAQVAATASRYVTPGALETRPYLADSYLLVGAALSGGSAYALLRDFVRRVGLECFGLKVEVDIYAALNRLAAEVPAGSDGLRCDPRFAGTRLDAAQRGSLSGIGAANLTPGHLARALLEGLAETCRSLYGEMLSAGLAPRRRLVASGNAVRRNPVLAAALAAAFGLPLVTPRHVEEAAFGAALLAAAAIGELPSLAAAASLVEYC